MLLDKFYTNKDVAEQCIGIMLDVVPEWATFIEPSAGCGNFLFEHTCQAYDICPESASIIEQDFLSLDINGRDVCVYGNPPYGVRNKLSKAFIKHAISFTEVRWIAFLLPSVFQKHTLQKVFPPNWSLVSNTEMPQDSFTADGDPYSIPCIFQVWEKDSVRDDLRSIERVCFKNEHFEIVKTNGDFFVMGAAPRTLKLPEEVTQTNRGYWLKTNLSYDKLLSNLNNVPWDGKSSAGGWVAWLTKTEFINQYESCFKIGEFNG